MTLETKRPSMAQGCMGLSWCKQEQRGKVEVGGWLWLGGFVLVSTSDLHHAFFGYGQDGTQAWAAIGHRLSITVQFACLFWSKGSSWRREQVARDSIAEIKLG
jgi:hypothetical protein